MSFKQLGSASPGIGRMLKRIGQFIDEREEREGPVTYSCHVCRDTQFETKIDERGQFRSKPCEECGEHQRPSDLGRIERLREIAWEIDGEDKIRLRHREAGAPTMWIYPDGRMCEYPPYRALPHVGESAYQEFFAKAKSARRIGQTEITKPYRR